MSNLQKTFWARFDDRQRITSLVDMLVQLSAGRDALSAA